jgi:uncharacterized membrane protein (TIGR02234 family)
MPADPAPSEDARRPDGDNAGGAAGGTAGGAVGGTAGDNLGGAAGDPTGDNPGGTGVTGRRLLAYTVVVCLGGAGLALYGVTRVWSVVVTARPGLSDVRATRTGAEVLPWLPALALVGLAGAGALLATRGRARRILGGVLAGVGGGIVAGAVAGRVGLDTGVAAGGGVVWPAACVLGGVLVALGGWRAVRQGHRWPSMGARYERRPADPVGDPGTDQSRAAGPVDTRPVDTRAAWDALDRGDDPTLR